MPAAGHEIRIGARRLTDVPARIVSLLEGGAPSVNHVEQMSIDFGKLLTSVLPEAASRAPEFDNRPFLNRMRLGAQITWDHYGLELFERAPLWSSDTLRGWAAFAIPLAGLTLLEQLRLASDFADDPHFAVREWAWLAVRDSIIDDPQLSLDWLRSHRANDLSPRIRRFCAEATRPRGVWSRHIALLKVEPERGQPLLDLLVGAPEQYVRDSVANWVNDVARTRADWVEAMCEKWRDEHGSAVDYVIRRASRNWNRR